MKKNIYVRDKKVSRIVIKVGSNLLINNQSINKDFIAKLCEQIMRLRQNGIECLLVSSGSIGCGLEAIGKVGKKLTVPQNQAAAAIGQGILIHHYSEAFKSFNITVAQLLVTYEDMSTRLRYLNIKNTVTTLLEQGIVPIFNENDTVSVEEITFGDNDYLSALITHLVKADLLVLMSTIDGLIDFTKEKSSSIRIIRDVTTIDDSITSLIKDTKSIYGTGGMTSKLNAAQKLMQTGHMLAIINGTDCNNLNKLLSNEVVGTVFHSRQLIKDPKKLWIGFASKAKGNIVVDEGAAKAITDYNKSLLPIGITSVQGEFIQGDIVNIIYNGNTIAKGQTNYDSYHTNKIKQQKSEEISGILGFKPYDEVIHTDNIILI